MARTLSTVQLRRATAMMREWRCNGVPDTVTGHEAWRLTHGAAGREGDHSTPWSLARCAARAAKQ